MATETTASTVESSATEETSIGPDGNVVGALAYVLAPLSGVLVYLLEDENQFARFHAAQSIAFGVGAIVLWIGLVLVTGILAVIPVIGTIFGLISLVAYPILSLALLIGWVFLIVKAYQGEATVLPILGPIAEENLL